MTLATVLRAVGVLVSLGLALLLVVPTPVIAAMPASCLFRRLFGFECWGCGMTRALSCALHGDFVAAFAYNRAVTVVLPLLFFIGPCQKQ